jgi:serine phosphatase RsbU (regulator of sigma subunit)
MQTNKPLISLIEKESWKNGTITWVSHSKTPLRIDSGETIGLIGISRDVTEERKSKQLLEEQNTTMRADIASAEKVQQIMIPGRIPSIEGIVEASTPSGEEFGLDRLQHCIQSHASLPLQASLDKLYEFALQFIENTKQQDDITLLAFEIQ